MNGTDALAEFCPAAEIAPATGEGYVRSLRGERRDLWPDAPRGRGSRRVHLQVHHITNLMLALADPMPINAPATVDRLSTLVPIHTTERHRVEVGQSFAEISRIIRAEFEYATLGEMIDNTLRMLACMGPELRAATEAAAEKTEWQLSLTPSIPVARLTHVDATGVLHTVEFAAQGATQGDLPGFAPPTNRARVNRTTTIPFALLVVSAGIVADAVAAEFAAIQTTPESENAAPGRAAPHENQPPHTERPGPLDTREVKGAGEDRQPPSARKSARTAGNSFTTDERPPDDSRPYPFDAAAA
ncbi:hypothetical protein [Siccirubricoccus deserti]|uniref:Uncharacterized protein n=1 Tax=Siccirubricoccus deserti TaxID=2013562 RepID=A0A9X0R359_9PROT|nr:hypothetical protein [Siccirubricoccus deserti]MBC4018721.1 hypothetical protein [Siccirubricoccus deserti]